MEYTLDALGRPIGVDVQRGAVSTQLASSIDYLPFGPIRDLVLGNGIAVQRDFDLDGRLVAQKDGSVRDVEYDYDTRNNVTDLLDLLDATRSASYSYDGLSRLIAASRGGSNWQYGYDAAGNRTAKMASVEVQGPVQANATTAEVYEYALASNRLETVAGTRVQSLTYDQNGNTVGDGTQVVDFNEANRAVSFGPGHLDLPTLTRQYNALGQRVAETRLPETPLEVRTHYRYGPQGNLIAERVAGVQTRTYVHLEGRPLATWSIPSDPVTEDDLGEPALYYYHTDHLGTPRKLTDASGAIAWDADYAPFGEASVRAEEVVNHLRFPGQYHSPETGLHYNWFRDYDPKSGRYIESDPIGLLGGMNTYGYTGGNPVNVADPYGLDFQEKARALFEVGPYDAYRAGVPIRKQAFDVAGRSGLPGPHNGPQDAYRHCVWSCELARQLNAEDAREVAAEHERAGARGTPPQPNAERKMDDANNRVGRECAASPADCALSCMDKLINGNLYGPGGVPMAAPSGAISAPSNPGPSYY